VDSQKGVGSDLTREWDRELFVSVFLLTSFFLARYVLEPPGLGLAEARACFIAADAARPA
jgi:hypothetical protein